MAVDPNFEHALRTATAALGLALAPEAVEGMRAHFVRLVETNASFNLTRITEPRAAAVKLYADSLAPLAWLAQQPEIKVHSVLDVGTGAGFPAVPVAIARPTWRVTAVDSTGKKAAFVARCAREIPIANLTAEHARAGEWKAPRRFNLVLLKAVGELARCLEFVRGCVAPGGCVAIYKGRGLTREELDAGQSRAESLGLQTWDCADYDLPLGEETLEHTLVVYRKTQP
jgi:16S rRNA (guanine527-N7)-methyltransferase